jgi:hypothetical protein
MDSGELVDRLGNAAEALADSISFDMNGNLIGGKWMGGHGGLISHETIVKADEVRRAIASFRSAKGASDAE